MIECSWCGKPINDDKIFCSEKCRHEFKKAKGRDPVSEKEDEQLYSGCFTVVVIILIIGFIADKCH